MKRRLLSAVGDTCVGQFTQFSLSGQWGPVWGAGGAAH